MADHDSDFIAQLQGHSLTTAEILYRLPDHQSLIQEFTWQDYDTYPKFPKLMGFLDFWSTELDGPLFRIRVAHKRLISPADFNFLDGELRLN